MSARWTGKPGKIVPLNRKRETKRMSIKVPGSGDDFHECRTRGEYDENAQTRSPQQPGQKKLYTPEQVYNYKSQWARYERGLQLVPDKIGDYKGKLAYFYASCDAPEGFWHVTLEAGATFIRAGKYLTIICPVPYQLNQVESDGEEFVWTQRFGSRTVTVNPPNAKNPTLYFENDCYTPPQCDSGTDLPIILRVQVKDQLDLFDDLLIFNTPTSSHFGNSFRGKASDTPCKKVQLVAAAPQYEYKAYLLDGSPVGVTWELPECQQDLIVKFVVQRNVTGQYVDVAEFDIDDERFFLSNVNQHYRIETVFKNPNRNSYSFSKPFYFSHPKLTLFGDDTQRGISFKGFNRQPIKTISVGLILEIEDAHRGIASQGKGFYRKYNLSSQKIELQESYRGIAASFGKQKYQKYNLGGIVIG